MSECGQKMQVARMTCGHALDPPAAGAEAVIAAMTDELLRPKVRSRACFQAALSF